MPSLRGLFFVKPPPTNPTANLFFLNLPKYLHFKLTRFTMSEQVESERRTTNLLRLGTILAVNHAKGVARVQSGGIETDWLPWITPRAGDVKVWSPPKEGEQVIVLAVGGEFTTGVILPSIFASNAPNSSADEFSVHFPDGAELKYNFASGHFSLTGCKTATVQASEQVTVDCPQSTFTGNVQINGTLSVNQAITAKSTVTASGGISSTGGDVKAGNISLKTHVHAEQGDGRDTSTAK